MTVITDLNLTNQAVSLLAANITAIATVMTVTPGDGNLKFPTTAGGKYFMVFLVKADKTYEIVKCTSRTGDSLTIERGAEGTVALPFTTGDAVGVRVTAGNFNDFITLLAAHAASLVSQDARIVILEAALAAQAAIAASGQVIAYMTDAAFSVADETYIMVGAGSSTYTKISDTAGALSAATGVWTVPATGSYQVNFSAALLATATATTYFHCFFGNSAGSSIDLVGSSVESVVGTNNNAIYSAGGGLLSLTAGATYGLWIWHENTGLSNRSLLGGAQGTTMLTINRIK